jgi:hypothetical protein
MADNYKDDIIPLKERKRIRDQKIRALYRILKSMDLVVLEMKKLGYGVSKTTVFFVVNGRSTKKSAEKRKIRKSLKNNNNHNNKNHE